MKSYRFLGEAAEALGNRLDHARNSLSGAKSKWAKNYWSQTVERLLFQWKQLPILHDADAIVTIIPRWHVDYEFFEKSEEVVYGGFFDRLYHKHTGSSPDLTRSWENNRAIRLAKAQ